MLPSSSRLYRFVVRRFATSSRKSNSVHEYQQLSSDEKFRAWSEYEAELRRANSKPVMSRGVRWGTILFGTLTGLLIYPYIVRSLGLAPRKGQVIIKNEDLQKALVAKAKVDVPLQNAIPMPAMLQALTPEEREKLRERVLQGMTNGTLVEEILVERLENQIVPHALSDLIQRFEYERLLQTAATYYGTLAIQSQMNKADQMMNMKKLFGMQSSGDRKKE